MKKEEFLTTLFEEFNRKNVVYFVYGEYRTLPTDTGGSDIDIIIGYKDLQQAKKIIKLLCDDNEVILSSIYTNEAGYFHRFITITPTWGVQIDIFIKGFMFRGISYYPMSNASKDVIKHNGINVLRIQKGCYIGFLKEIIHLGKAKDKYIQGFYEEVNTDLIAYKKEITDLYGDETSTIIFTNLSIEGLKIKSKDIRNAILRHLSLLQKATIILNKLSLFKRFIQKRPGYVIAILGTDGSGKSTIINQITPILNEGFHNGIVYNHLRPNAIPDLGVLMGKKEKMDTPMVVSDPHAGKSSGLVGSLIRWGYYLIDYTIGYLKTVFPVIHTKSKIFIFDRYYYDYYIDQKRSKTNLPNWIIKIGELFVPKPDIILCLGGNPEKIYQRKPETSLEEVTRQTNALKEFCNQHKNAIWIDTCTDIQESTEMAMNAICDTMKKRKFNL